MGEPEDSIEWEALRRECELVAEHLGIGATAIGKAGPERTATYAQAFFALSVGFERAAKLALTLDSALSEEGKFLDSSALRNYGHRLDRLLKAVERVAKKRAIADASLPDTAIHRAIVATLTNFASNVNRYYNLEVLASANRAAEDPIAAWYLQVTQPVLDAHDTEQRRQQAEAEAVSVAVPASMYVVVRATTETGEIVRTLPDALLRGQEARAARPWERMYILQLARFVTHVLTELGERAQAAGLPVPYVSEYFYKFRLDDSDFRRLKVWTL